MAYVRLKGRRWHVYYADAHGVWRSTTTTAKTKTEANRLKLELERKVERQRLGLEPLARDLSSTFWELCDWWLEKRCRPRSRDDERYRLGKHVKDTELGKTQIQHVTKSTIDDRLCAMEREGAAAGSVNKLRSILHTVIERARDEEPPLWIGPNPVERIEARKTRKRVYEVLHPEEVDVVLAHSRPNWRGEIATAIFTGMRKGEILGLRKSDVDLKRRTIAVRRSFDSDTTKTDEEATIPIPSPLLPYLEAAIGQAKGDIVFPGRDGKMRTEESDPEKALRRALGRAGIVLGYDHVCRRCKAAGMAGHTARHQDAGERRCATCGMKLWPVAVPRAMRFHDLRHSTATILLARGVPMQHVSRILRHANIRTTVDLYGHMTVEHLRDAVEALPGGRSDRPVLGQPPPAPETKNPAASDSPETSPGSEWALLVSNQRPPPCEESAPGLPPAPRIAKGA